MEHNRKQTYTINREDRTLINKHKPCLIWFTGLSGSGKSTIANLLEKELHKQGVHTYTLDGDNLRRGLNKDLLFTKEDRIENLRRTAEVAKLFIDAGLVVIAAFISPYNKTREDIKAIVGSDYYIEVFVNTPLEVCEQRDVKGLYKKARAGTIKNFTGISAPFEIPTKPTLEVETLNESPEEAVVRILDVLKSKL
ncbi:Adenylyl-sulfate kinase [Mariniflexile rhizosphaerae]|uniref:adenylyl-sulfate kinase n=1 Tax=unclassified Mariniflexile TaxID=2643887 RepID=UPI000CC00104|nr:adenylyl-sulfate kinase [Mariniflexile sp. TRM1-10]AXP79287.1 Adenylyl-sulfate kinase [Mariniflexile sp. TRM1-10]PLB17891.1 MAG: Adenylyl-sulfate kinase [Flavobacteriaceae bacterium FS1-H7996/R]